MSRRTTEMLLLLLAAPPVLLLYAMLLTQQGTSLSLSALAVPLGIFGAFGLAHVAIRIFAPNADPAILPIVFALSSLGITFVTRLAPESALGQVMWLFMGVIAMVLVLMSLQHIDSVAKYKYTLMLLGVILLLSPLLPIIGLEANGSRLWLNFNGLSFQPGEIAKVLIVLFLGGYLAQNRELLSISTMEIGPFHIPDLRALIPILAVGAISFIIVIFEKDLGSALIVFSLFLALLYVGSGRKLYLFVGLGVFAFGAIILYQFFGHVQTRVAIWQDPFSDAAGNGYQLVQSIYSLADGGLFGVGMGRGLAENIPFASTDFIFAAIAEETGLLGSGAVLLLYLLLAVRGFATASRARSDVSSFIAVGATLVIVLQAFIIIGGVTKLIPLTGITLPFMSRGGSSLLASFISIGLILRCGDEGTGFVKELQDGTTSMRAISLDGKTNEAGVLGRVALGNRLTATIIALALMFAILLANLTYIMVVKADEYRS
ncbi:MAG: FtsW/RodA/SpoVE family cell cycle protein, partial [Eggerthellaceae bacterium]|nr:FtsW/RodA/SpoVE family cell cycle protein [Eggerthellaceae bacterium]